MTGTLIDLLILVGVLAIAVVAIWFVLNQLSLPEPVNKIIMICLVVLIAVIAIILLLRLGGGGGGRLLSEAYTPIQVSQAVRVGSIV